MTWIQTVIIAIVEGLTEFLPVSSTGHMIIAQNILGVESTDFVKAFTERITEITGIPATHLAFNIFEMETWGGNGDMKSFK